MEFLDSLWRYPDAKFARPEMNVLMLLANAIETVRRQQTIISRQGWR